MRTVFRSRLSEVPISLWTRLCNHRLAQARPGSPRRAQPGLTGGAVGKTKHYQVAVSLGQPTCVDHPRTAIQHHVLV